MLLKNSNYDYVWKLEKLKLELRFKLILYNRLSVDTAQKLKFSITDFFSKSSFLCSAISSVMSQKEKRLKLGAFALPDQKFSKVKQKR